MRGFRVATDETLLYSFFDLLDFDLAEALDLQERSAGGAVDGLDEVLSALMSLELFNYWTCKSVLLPQCRSHWL